MANKPFIHVKFDFNQLKHYLVNTYLKGHDVADLDISYSKDAHGEEFLHLKTKGDLND